VVKIDAANDVECTGGCKRKGDGGTLISGRNSGIWCTGVGICVRLVLPQTVEDEAIYCEGDLRRFYRAVLDRGSEKNERGL
jgi:hypothetical protein